MKLVKTASGKQTIKLSKSEWTNIGKKAGWMKKANRTLGNFEVAVGFYGPTPTLILNGVNDNSVTFDITEQELKELYAALGLVVGEKKKKIFAY